MSGKDKILNSFPLSLTNDVVRVIDMLKVKDDDVSNRHYNVTLAGTIMHIPERIYMSDLKPHRDMTNVDSIIIDCIFTRHYDGFVRQQHLQSLLNCMEYWVIPFFFRLLGEYVEEILFDVKVHIDSNIDNYVRFIEENKTFFDKTKNQMISYWDCYYRTKWPKRESYIGFIIFSYLEMAYKKRLNHIEQFG